MDDDLGVGDWVTVRASLTDRVLLTSTIERVARTGTVDLFWIKGLLCAVTKDRLTKVAR